MFLIIYERKGQRFHNFADKLRGRFKVVTEDFTTYCMTSKDIIDYFKIDSWQDFWDIKDDLAKYKFQILITKAVYKDHTDIGLTVMLLNNVIRTIGLIRGDVGDESLKDDEYLPSLYEVKCLNDWLEAEREFEFECDLKDKIFKEVAKN